MIFDETFEVEMVSLVLEDTLNELKIAKKICAGEAKADMDFNDKEKLMHDYTSMIRLLDELKNEILNSNTSTVLETFINAKEQETIALETAKFNADEAKLQLEIAKLELADEEVKHYQEVQSRNVQVGMLKDQYQDKLWEREVKFNYANKWHEAQIEQDLLRLRQNEQLKQKVIERYENDLEREHKVHEELDNFYSMKLGDYIQQLVDWVDKYEQDKISYDERITSLKTALETLRNDMKTAKELYDSRVAEMKAYDELKEKRRLEQLAEEHLNRQATKIQAWWRGLMVRCKLGPYKVKKGKANKGKGKKNK